MTNASPPVLGGYVGGGWGGLRWFPFLVRMRLEGGQGSDEVIMRLGLGLGLGNVVTNPLPSLRTGVGTHLSPLA